MNGELLRAVRDHVKSVYRQEVNDARGTYRHTELDDAAADEFINAQDNTWLLGAIDSVSSL